MVHAERNWWALLIRGIAAVLFGILALAVPGLTLRVLIALFGAYALIDGIFSIVAAVRAIGRHGRFGWLLFEGIVGVIAGILAFVLPGLTALVLLYVIGAWAIITGIMEIVQAIELRRVIRNEWLLILGGAASVIFGVLLFLFPGAGALAVVWLIGAYAIIFGALLIALSLRLRATHAGTRETMTPAY